MLHWLRFKRHLSAYRDHSLRADEFRSVWGHLYHCRECSEDLSAIENLGEALQRLPAPPVPKDLAFQVRARLSQARAERERPTLFWRLRNQWGHMALPGSAGLCTALLFFAMFASHFSVSERALSNLANDVPIELSTPARPRDTRLLNLDSRLGDLVVQVIVDPQGRVADYDIVEGTYTPEELRHLQSNLLFAVFEPAMVFGVPTSGTLVFSYHRVHVRG
jgi:hypothetical protein